MSVAVLLDPLLVEREAVARAVADLAGGRRAGALAVARPAWPAVLAALHRAGGRPLLVVAPDDDRARDLAAELEALAGRDAVALWPARGVPAGGAVGPAPHLVGLRAQAQARVGRPGTIVVAGAPALAERVPAPRLRPEPLVLSVGEELSQDALVDRLVALGYERVPQVEERGDLAVRGGLLDVYPSTAEMPLRVDFFGDAVEELRAFSPFTQRTIRREARVEIWPAVEVADELVDTLDELAASGAAIVLLAPDEHAHALREAAERLEDEAAAGALADPDVVLAALREASALELVPPAGRHEPAFDATEARFATRGLSEAEAEIARLARGGRRVVVAFGRRGELERARHQLERTRPLLLDARGELPRPGQVAFAVLPLRRGFVSDDLGLALIPERALFRRRRPAGERRPAARRLSSFLDLRVGDYVVHEDHGIGRLTGFETRTVANVTRDYLALAFADGARLLVPHDQLDKVSRYIGADGSAPALSKLGGKAWERLKSRARAAVREMAGELIALYQARARAQGVAFPPDDELMRELERRFPYEETPDQARAIDAVTEDMERPRPMDRLICGDVGFGKTEIAIRAAVKAAAAGRQVMMLVPTTILAQQHLATFRERLADLPVTVDAVNRMRSPAEVRDALARFREGKLDILIGTHRLLSMDVQPRDLGLVIVDEEQRFGVAQKEALRKLRLRTDVLAMSATPIPRTLQMSLSGLRDISVIETPPPGRRPIATHVGEYDDGLVREALLREHARGGQSFYLHNRVETIEAAAERVRALVPELRVAVAHGQMPEAQLEDVMTSFVRGEGDVLVATSIIEAGLDIPSANTLIVERADQLGLSQLYQIRGRVGRSDATAHAYLLYPDGAALTHEAASRLRAVADYTELGSGLKIALRDLEIRGAGNLLGDEQSGHVAAIGFELYLDMLNEAIAQGSGEAEPEREVRVDIRVSAYIPSDYVPFEAAKIDLHRRIALARDHEALSRLRSEFEDRFGPVPEPVEALLRVQELRVALRRLGAAALAVRGGRLTIAPISLTSAQLRALREAHPRARYDSRAHTVTAPAGAGPTEQLDAAGRLLETLLASPAVAA
jgi:transcription-repair coupling factor (superfamily II helicase)